MSHVMILGQTMSGKTTLAKKLAKSYFENGIGVLVYDPFQSDWICNYISSNPSEFFNTYSQSDFCAVFIDESGDLCNTHPNFMIRTATRGRHRGHRNHYVAQRGVLIKRTIRDQCNMLFLFNTALEDSKTHSNEWNDLEIKNSAPFLKKGEFFYKERLGELKRSNIF